MFSLQVVIKSRITAPLKHTTHTHTHQTFVITLKQSLKEEVSTQKKELPHMH